LLHVDRGEHPEVQLALRERRRDVGQAALAENDVGPAHGELVPVDAGDAQVAAELGELAHDLGRIERWLVLGDADDVGDGPTPGS
jgi:hypothetical protein